MEGGLLLPFDNPAPGVYRLASERTVTICLGPIGAETMDPKHSITNRPAAVCSKEHPRPQVGATCVGVVFSFAYVCRSCSCNAIHALVKRHGVVQPVVSRRLTLDPALRAAIRQAADSLDASVYERYYDRFTRTQRHQVELSVEHDKLLPGVVKAFVKREVGLDPPKKARLIQGYPNDRTKVEVAPEFVLFQKAIVSVCKFYELHPGVTITIASGFSGPDLADWMVDATSRCVRPFFLERDGSAWDATMQRMHHDTKLFYMRVVSPRLCEFVESGFTVKGSVSSSSGWLNYKLFGTVKSGHNDTTSGNSLINALICADALRAISARGHVIVAGDDALIVVDGDFDLDGYVAVERELGIVPKARKFDCVEDVSFISGVWIPAGASYIFAPMLGRLLAKLWWTVTPPAAKDFENYRHSVVSGIRPSVGHLPLYREFLDLHDFTRAKIIAIDKWKFSPYLADQPTVESDVVLGYFARRYHLSHRELSAFCDFLTRLPAVPSFVAHPVSDVILRRDLADLADRVPAG